jgi:hypothetical protein
MSAMVWTAVPHIIRIQIPCNNNHNHVNNIVLHCNINTQINLQGERRTLSKVTPKWKTKPNAMSKWINYHDDKQYSPWFLNERQNLIPCQRELQINSSIWYSHKQPKIAFLMQSPHLKENKEVQVQRSAKNKWIKKILTVLTKAIINLNKIRYSYANKSVGILKISWSGFYRRPLVVRYWVWLKFIKKKASCKTKSYNNLK